MRNLKNDCRLGRRSGAERRCGGVLGVRVDATDDWLDTKLVRVAGAMALGLSKPISIPWLSRWRLGAAARHAPLTASPAQN